VGEDRAGRIWASINACARADGAPLSIRHACIACVHAVGAVGAGLSMTRGPGLREPVFATDRRSEELEELQYTLGQGPYVDAADGDGPVLVADLSAADSRSRWPLFAAAAADRGIRGMLAIPIQAGAARIGILDVYRLMPGLPSNGELADALAYADAVLVLALDHHGGIASDLNSLGDKGLTERRAEVHQAVGMMSVQLGIDVTGALARLRAHAFLHDRRLAEVAADVVTRRLRFHPDRGDDGGAPGDERPRGTGGSGTGLRAENDEEGAG
jgi:hypothetical protein